MNDTRAGDDGNGPLREEILSWVESVKPSLPDDGGEVLIGDSATTGTRHTLATIPPATVPASPD